MENRFENEELNNCGSPEESNPSSPEEETEASREENASRENEREAEASSEASSPFFDASYSPYSVYNDPYYGKKLREKRELRRATTAAAVPTVILMLAMSLFSTALFAVLSLFFDMRDIYGFFSEPAISSVYSIIISSLFFAVPFAVAGLCRSSSLGELVPFKKPLKGTAVPMLLIGIAFCGFANILSALADSFFSALGFNYALPDSPVAQGAWGFVISILAICVEPALMEEFAMRGVTLGIFRRWGSGFAIAVSAVIFGIMHGNFVQIPFAFLVGIALGYIRVKTESMWIACAVHAVNNFVSVLFDYLPSSDSLNAWYTVYLMLCMLLGFLGLMLLNKNGISTDIKEERPESELTLPEKLKAVFTHPLIIAAAVIALLESLSYFDIVPELIALVMSFLA